MKEKVVFILLVLFIVLNGISLPQENSRDFQNQKGLYLGQKPPGMTPELFAPEIFSKVQPEWVFCTEFSPEGKYFFYMSTEVLNKPARTNTYWVDAQIIYKRLPKE